MARPWWWDAEYRQEKKRIRTCATSNVAACDLKCRSSDVSRCNRRRPHPDSENQSRFSATFHLNQRQLFELSGIPVAEPPRDACFLGNFLRQLDRFLTFTGAVPYNQPQPSGRRQ